MPHIRSALTFLASNWRTKMLAAVILLQVVSACFFIGDVFWELTSSGLTLHTAFETCAAVALVCGVIFGFFEMIRMYRTSKFAQDALRIAADAFGEMIRSRFDTWKLSPTEQEVALLTLKGFDVSEIADLRRTAQGTVRAQQTSIYSKSGTANRGQFVSSFIDALIETPVAGRAAIG
ncbi:helix-turn-helix transcriptional regulator [Roseibium sp.]|uniref:helix-turn-helix transcriptional regulator n=2 Tax=Roseibium sp. TaxID=1936156 RepID=UPI003D0BB28A